MRRVGDSSGLVEPISYGRVTMVDRAAGRCVVAAGDINSQAIPWLERRAGTTRSWSPPSVGEQGVLVCPGGDPAGAFFIAGAFSDAHPPIADETREALELPGGTTIHYDPADGLTITLGAGKVAIVAPDGVSIQGDVTIEGKLTASDDVVAAGKSLKTHKHTGVAAGGAISGAPQ